MANHSPRDDNRIPAILVKDTISLLATPVSGLALSGVEAAVVALVDSSGNQISSFSGGTQYTDGGIPPAHPTGGTILWSDGANWQTVSLAKPLPTSEVATTTVFNGKTSVTTAGTRVVLASSTPVKSVTIKALAANTGIIYVGNATVAASNGFALAAGDSVSLDISNLNTVNLDCSVNGESVTYIAIN